MSKPESSTPSADRDRDRIAPHLVRVAVVQLAYLPAFEDHLSEPTPKAEKAISCLLPDGAQAAPEIVQKPHKELRRRIRATYVKQLKRRVEAVLEACKRWEVKLVVFPEYSIPPEILPELASVAPEIVVVAGSHFVDRETLRGEYYEKLGKVRDEELLQNSASPVLFGGKLEALVKKIHPAKAEAGVIKPGDEWAPVSLPPSLPGPMAVLICLDFLARNTEPHLEKIASELQDCRFIAAPALSPKHTIDEFMAKAHEHARRDFNKKPVFFANDAQYGGSTLVVDEDRIRDLSLFPEHAGRLEAGEEGIVVADVDLGARTSGDSRSYEIVPTIVPIAAASFVYRGIEQGYAAWAEQVAEKLSEAGKSDFRKLEELAAWVESHEPEIPKAESARRRRLLRFTQSIEDESNLDRVKKWTTELLLPENVLPLPILRAALARGAADVIEQWEREHNLGDFGPVVKRLRESWERLNKNGWTPQTHVEANAVRKDVAGNAKGVNAQALLAKVDVYEAVILERFREKDKEAIGLLRAEQFAEARERYREILKEVEALIEKGGNGPEADLPVKLLQQAARCRMHIAFATLNLQETAEAHDALIAVDPAMLSLKDRCQLLSGLAMVGEVARAKELLPKAEEVSEEAKKSWAHARSSIALAEGKIPESLGDDEETWLGAAYLYLTQNNDAEAARLSSAVLQKNGAGALSRALAVLTLVPALANTVQELPIAADPPPQRIALDGTREEIVALLERAFPALRAASLPEQVRKSLLQADVHFRAMTSDHDGLTPYVADSLASDDGSYPSDSERMRAYELAQNGEVDEALRILPPDPHPWRRRAEAAELLAQGKQFDRALKLAEPLAKEFPDRAGIERILAELLMRERRPQEALEHATRAYLALPGIGNRLLLVQARSNVEDWQGAFDLLRDHLDDERPLVQRAIAVTAQFTQQLDLAESAWKRYCEKTPQDGRALVSLAQVQYTLHKPQEAAETSYRAFVEHGDRLSPDELYLCGFYQALGLSVETERVEKIKKIAKKIHECFPKNIHAEELRAQLLMQLREIPADVERIDFDALVEKGTMMRGFDFDSLITHLQTRREFLNVVFDAAQKGAFPIGRFLPMANNDPATFITGILDFRRAEAGLLCPPISLVDEPPALPLANVSILLGSLELFLLLKLDLLGPLQKAIEPGGRLLLFERVRDEILANAANLRVHARPEKLDATEALLRKIERWEEVSADQNIPVLAFKEPKAQEEKESIVSPYAYVQLLEQKGILTDAEKDGFLAKFGPEGAPQSALPEPLPERVAISSTLVEYFDTAGLLEKVLVAAPPRIVLDHGTRDWLRRQRDDQREAIAAAALADQAHEALVKGRVHFIAEPSADEVPPLREGEAELYEQLVREPLCEMVSYRKAVLDGQNRWRLSAEYFGSMGLGLPEWVRELAWAEKEQYQSLVGFVRNAAQRDLTIPSLVRLLVENEKERDKTLRLLASLGFADALGAAEILRLDKEYKGLQGEVPKRYLQAMEWMATHPQHLGGDYARLRLANAYAAAAFEAYCAKDRSEAEQLRVLDQLLSRLEGIGEKRGADPLDRALLFLAGRTADQWRLAWVPTDERQQMRMDTGSAIARLWQAVLPWCQVNFVRRSALGRALRMLWTMLSQREGGPLRPVAMTLSFTFPDYGGKVTTISLLDPAIEAVSILSAAWEKNPFEKLWFSHFLKNALPAFSKGAMELVGGRFAEANATFSDSKAPVRLLFPMEGLFLRLPAEEKKTWAERIQYVQGRYDGLAHELLGQIKEKPDDPELLRGYAAYAAGAHFRLVQDDPSYLARMGKGSLTDGGPISPFVLLLRMLSEPNAPLPEGDSITEILAKRIDEGGVWADRVDAVELVCMAAEMPGLFPPAVAIGIRLQDPGYEQEVALALNRIEHPHDSPIARIVLDLYFLRVAASNRPLVSVAGKLIDLRDELPSRMQMLLERMIADPPPDTMGAFEAALLRVCGAVIQRLALPDHTPIREGIFWTYRLFQWLCLQLDAIAPDARLDGMRRLAALAPPPNDPKDILDPFGFGRDHFDHRLASVLYAMALLHILDLPVERPSGDPLPEPRPISSPDIEQRLLELAKKSSQGPQLGTLLDWHLPGNIPDIALFTLLQLNSARFADLGEEARMRRFDALVKNPESFGKERSGARALQELVITAAASQANVLTAMERKTLETKIREMEDSPETRRYRRMVLISLYAAGEDHLKTEAYELVTQDIADTNLGALLGNLFLTAANQEPASLGDAVQRISQQLAEKGADRVQLIASALARVLNMGKPEAKKAARALCLRLAKEEPFRDDMRMREILAFFNIRENQA